MKKLAVLVCGLFLVAGVASAAQATTPAKPAAPAKADVAKSHVVEAEVVSMDVEAKTLTVKTDKGDATMKVEGDALAKMKELKAGEKVALTCRDNAEGEHQAITHIKMMKMMMAPPTK